MVGFLVLLFLAGVVRDPRSDRLPFRSFHPLPDAIEYAVGASHLAAGRGLWLTIDDREIPSRYPPGFPLLIALFYRVLGNDVVHAYWVSIACGAGAIPLMFLLARALVPDPAVARWSAFLLATNALVLSFAPLVMAETCSVLLALAALNLAVRIGPDSRAASCAALGGILGFAVMVRTANVLMVGPLAAYLAWMHGRRLGLRLWSALAAPLAAGMAVLLLFNARVFGSPLRDGYALYTPRTMFAWEFFAAHAPPYFRTLLLAEGGKTIWLEGPFYGLLVPVLAAVGVVALGRAGRRDVLALAAIWVLTFYVFFAAYFFYDFRFFLPVIPILLLLAACGLAGLLRHLRGRGRAVAAAAAVVLYLVQPLFGGTSPLDAARRNRTTSDPPANYLHVRALNDYMERIDAHADANAVLSALNLVYHDRFSNHRYTLIPLSRAQEYARVPEVAARMPWPDVDELLARGVRVYVSDFAVDDAYARDALAALAARYRLEPVPDAGTSLARVAPAAP
jgi:4-amino-4-deoxy-L-arabinose transferase-like glycosyltransferase